MKVAMKEGARDIKEGTKEVMKGAGKEVMASFIPSFTATLMSWATFFMATLGSNTTEQRSNEGGYKGSTLGR